MTIAWFLQVFPWLWTLRIRRYMRLYGDGRSGHSLRWNGQPLKCSGFPVLLPIPFSPVQRARKFSAVLGTTSAKSSNTIRPAAKRKKTSGMNHQIVSLIFSYARDIHFFLITFFFFFLLNPYDLFVHYLICQSDHIESALHNKKSTVFYKAVTVTEE